MEKKRPNFFGLSVEATKYDVKTYLKQEAGVKNAPLFEKLIFDLALERHCDYETLKNAEFFQKAILELVLEGEIVQVFDDIGSSRFYLNDRNFVNNI